MKKILSVLLAGGAFFLTSCETTREITLKEDGSGIIVTTTDMSGLIGMAKMAGQGNQEMQEMGDKSIDTTIQLSSIVDSLKDLSSDERELVKKGTLGFIMNMEDEKFVTRLEFPFASTSQLPTIDKVTGKVVKEAMKSQMGKDEKKEGEEGSAGMPGADDLPEGSMDDYYEMTYSNGLIEKKLNKEKYAKVDEDQGMKALQEMSSMGIGSTTLIFNLPRAAKKVEGKNAKLSEDKMKVTITSSAEDFFDDATDLEFRIEY